MVASALIEEVNKLRSALKSNTYDPTAANAEAIWESIFGEMRAVDDLTGNDLAPTWSAVKSSNMVSVLFEAVFLSIEKDPEGKCIPVIAACLLGIWTLLRALLSGGDALKHDDALTIDILAGKTPKMLEDIWSTYQQKMASWIQVAGCFEDRCREHSGIFVVMVVVSREQKSRTIFEDLRKTLENSAPIHEFMTVYIVCATGRSPNQSLPITKQMEAVVNQLDELCVFGSLKVQELPPLIQPRELLGQRCLDLIQAACQLTSSNGKDTYNPIRYDHTMSLIEILSRQPLIRDCMNRTDDLCLALARGAWFHRKHSDPKLLTDPRTFGQHLELIIRLLPPLPIRSNRTMDNLLTDYGLIDLFAVCLTEWAENVVWGLVRSAKPSGHALDMDYWNEVLQELGTGTKSVLKASILAHDFLNTLDLLKSQAAANHKFKKYPAAVPIWENLGTVAGVREADLRAEAIAACRAANGGVAGCSWYKCILHLQETDQIMHQCVGCGKVAYCDFYCQDRDWEEGHKDICSGNSQTTLEVARRR